MSILDDAIREHLELKRAHGADEAELQRLESEAFGPAERPAAAAGTIDPFSDAPTEFLATPGPAEVEAGGERRRPDVADLQEPPPAPAEAKRGTEAERSAAQAPSTPGGEEDEEAPAVEEHPAGEHATVPEPSSPDAPAAPGDQLRPDPDAPGGPPPEAEQGIVDQPTQMFDVEQQLFEDTAESASPSDEQLVDAERTGSPQMAPAPAEPEDEFDDFFSEQRLSDELNQALEAPLPDESDAPPTDQGPSPFLDPEAELGSAPPQTGESELPEDSGEHELPAAEEEEVADEFRPEPGHADALEDTPEFLEDQPEGEDAWFEQKPPKDFDFGD